MYRLRVHLHGVVIHDLDLANGRETTFGRGADCDIQLTESNVISRMHFRVREENGMPVAQAISRFAELSHGGSPVRNLPLKIGTIFKAGPYEFHFLESRAPESVALVPFAAAAGDVTRFAEVSLQAPSVRIVDSRRNSVTVLDPGHQAWIAGREDGSSILLNDRKASRKQFEIRSTVNGYFILDLASANGTLLNGKPLAPYDLRLLASGDVIQVGRQSIFFELHHPRFTEMLLSAHAQALQLDHQSYEARVERHEDPPKTRSWLSQLTASLIGALASASFFWMNATPDARVEVGAFEKLAPGQQQEVKFKYTLASNLLMQNQPGLAASYFEAIHKVIPEGYLRSLALAEECAQRLAIEGELLKNKAELRAREANHRLVEQAVKDCEKVARQALSEAEIKGCLRTAIELEPDYPAAKEQMARVHERIERRTREAELLADYHSKVAAGKALHERALQFDQEGDWQEALGAYRKHVASKYPDPENSKEQSKRRLQALEKQIKEKIAISLGAAQAAYDAANYKEAFDELARAKKLDPGNRDVKVLAGSLRRQLNNKLHGIYEDSVISEGLGRVEEAMKNWRTIKDMDSADGEYHQKVIHKLKLYGES